MTDIVPTEADRAAYIAFNNLPGVHLAEVRAGKWDNTTGMQAIARHAAQARLEVLEEAAKVAEEYLAGDDFDSRNCDIILPERIRNLSTRGDQK